MIDLSAWASNAIPIPIPTPTAKGIGSCARRQGLIPTNPAEAVELPGRDSVERGVFIADEIRRLVEVAEGEWKTLISVAYFTGLRLSECCRLEWSSLDLQAQVMSPKVKKTHKILTAPVHPDLVHHLGQIHTHQMVKSSYVMPGMAAKGPGGKHGLSEGFKRVVRRAGLDLQTVQGGGTRKISRRTFHALRHSFTSALANAGVPAEVRMKLTGHKTASSHQTYTHLELDNLRSALDKLPSLAERDS